MEVCNNPIEIINELMEIVPGDHTYCLINNSTACYTSQDKSNLVTAINYKIKNQLKKITKRSLKQ